MISVRACFAVVTLTLLFPVPFRDSPDEDRANDARHSGEVHSAANGLQLHSARGDGPHARRRKAVHHHGHSQWRP